MWKNSHFDSSFPNATTPPEYYDLNFAGSPLCSMRTDKVELRPLIVGLAKPTQQAQ